MQHTGFLRLYLHLSNLNSRFLEIVISATITTGITVTFMFHSFSALELVPGYSLYSFLSFTFTQLSVLIGSFYCLLVRIGVPVHLKIPEKYMRLFFTNIFCFLYIPFIFIVKFQFCFYHLIFRLFLKFSYYPSSPSFYPPSRLQQGNYYMYSMYFYFCCLIFFFLIFFFRVDIFHSWL